MVEIIPIFTNNNLSQVYQATKVCVRGKLMEEEEYQKKTIANSVGKGHESVLEHTNLICFLSIDKKDIKYADLLDIFEVCKYLNIRRYDCDNKIIVIISGSIRGYKHIFRNIKSLNNYYLQYIKDFLYATSLKDYYKDFIEDNIMDESKFASFVGEKRDIILDYDDVADVVSKSKIESCNDKIEYLWHDSIIDIQDQILEASSGKLIIPFYDLLDFCTIGIKFKGISRTASHQLVRHRNAISQESQRYVNYKNARFIDPELEDAIASNKENMDATISDKLKEVAECCIEAYNELVDPNGSYKAKKENARAILPSNIETTLIMTFTYKNLIKAIELRASDHAQSEIRNLFNSIRKDLNKFIGLETNEDGMSYLIQLASHSYYSKIDYEDIYVTEEGNEPDSITETIGEIEVTEVDKEEAKNNLVSKLGYNPYEKDNHNDTIIEDTLIGGKNIDSKGTTFIGLNKEEK